MTVKQEQSKFSFEELPTGPLQQKWDLIAAVATATQALKRLSRKDGSRLGAQDQYKHHSKTIFKDHWQPRWEPSPSAFEFPLF